MAKSSDSILHTLTETEVTVCRNQLLRWYDINRRKLPWRGDIISINGEEIVPPPITAYGSWVSEVMSQQTRIETVIPYWNRWMAAYPTVASLAVADSNDINRLWAGLGYYRRGRQLVEGAKVVMESYHGVVPCDVEDLLKIPGIGPYTAGAISSIAYGKPVPLVDGNVVRVLSRLFTLDHVVGTSAMDKATWSIAGQLVDPFRPGSFNQGLMELGATICTPISPKCAECPLQSICDAKALAEVKFSSNDDRGKLISAYPRRAVKKKPRDVVLAVYVLRLNLETSHNCTSPSGRSHDGMKYLFVRRQDTGLLARQWEFPNIVMDEVSELRVASKKLKTEICKEINSKSQMNFDVNRTDDAVDSKAVDLQLQQTDLSKNEYTVETLWKPFEKYFQRFKVSAPSEFQSICTDFDGNSSSVAAILLEKATLSECVKLGPVNHVFSHQRHIMHVVVRDVTVNASSAQTISTQREFRFMSARELSQLGMTSGCKKIIDLVESQQFKLQL